MTLNAYKKLDCDNLELISTEIYNFIKDKTELLTNGAIGWQFINVKELLLDIPELLEFFSKHKLAVRSASIVILYENGQLPIHIDELPVIAKINVPVINTVGWINRWFKIDQQELDNLPMVTNQFGALVEDLTLLTNTQLTLLTELADMTTPIVFNSRIPHDVIKTTATKVPRIIASFTFCNDPVRLLE
jgi:hypothetical protein